MNTNTSATCGNIAVTWDWQQPPDVPPTAAVPAYPVPHPPSMPPMLAARYSPDQGVLA